MNFKNLLLIDWKNFSIKDVLKGCSEHFFADYLNRGESYKSVVSYRLKLCGSCNLYNEGVCDPSRKGINILTGKEKSGCGCKIVCKTALKESKCPLGKWLSVK